MTARDPDRNTGWCYCVCYSLCYCMAPELGYCCYCLLPNRKSKHAISALRVFFTSEKEKKRPKCLQAPKRSRPIRKSLLLKQMPTTPKPAPGRPIFKASATLGLKV